MKKTAFIVLAVLIFCYMMVPSGSHAQNLDEIRARARSEARQQMGLDRPAAPKKTGMDIPFTRGQGLVLRLVLFALGIALLPAVIAKLKGRSFIAWWVLGTICFPVVLAAAVFMKKAKLVIIAEEQGSSGRNAKSEHPSDDPRSSGV